jgi:hypothetical protein
MVRRLVLMLASALVVGAPARADPAPPLLGAGYQGADCSGVTQVVRDRVDPTLVREQLFAMHASGLTSIAVGVNYSVDPGHLFDGHGGAVTVQSDGTLGEPYRSRLIQLLKDAKDAGFTELTMRFQAHGPNSPEPWTSGGYEDDWNPALYTVDWHLIQDVRALVKQYGPAQTHFDIMAEGPPSDYARTVVGPRIDEFMTRLYTDYEQAYGNGDVFFSAIGDDTGRLAHEIQDFLAAGDPMPQWWGLDPEYTVSGITTDLQRADAKLREYGLGGSIVLEETAYESPEIAAAIVAYNSTATHPVVQIEEYPNLGTPQCVASPFTANAYLQTFGVTAAPLQLKLGAKGRASFRLADGTPVVALKAGRYAISASDSSRTAGVSLTGFEVARRTTARFRGTVTWSVDFEGAGLLYHARGAKGTQPMTFTILP